MFYVILTECYKSSKGPVKLIKWVKIAESFSVCVKSVLCYHVKLAYVVLQMTVFGIF